MVLPILIVGMSYFYIYPIHRDNIYFDRHETNKNETKNTRKAVFDKWCKEYAGLHINLFNLFVNLFYPHETINEYKSRSKNNPVIVNH